MQNLESEYFRGPSQMISAVPQRGGAPLDDSRTDSFFDLLAGLLDASGQPAAVMDHDFRLVWHSAAGAREMPALALPDGAQLLLHGYDPEVVRAEIDRCGSFTTAGPDHLFAERPTVICALPDGSGRYLLLPASGAGQGSGMRPEGMSRTLSSFGNQYRAPLTVIFSMLTLLSRNCGPGSSEKDRERMPDYLAAINQSAFRLLRSSEWISDYTRLTYGFSPVRTRRVDLFHYLRELSSAAAALIEPTGIPLSADIPEGMLPAACDTQKVSAALLNILSNARRYTRPGNQIALRVRLKRGMLSVSVADRGLGIPPDVQPRVFEPYFSYDHGGRPFSGNGLGLTIARDSIAAIGGTIALTSTPGKGTTVVFTLPVEDDQSVPPAVFCDAADYLSDRFSPLRVALSDSIDCPL